MTKAQWIGDVPTDTEQDHIQRKAQPLERPLHVGIRKYIRHSADLGFHSLIPCPLIATKPVLITIPS